MDELTLRAYDSSASSFSTRWEAVPAEQLPYLQLARTFFHAGRSTADIGCGSGRDAAWLAGQGYAVKGYDASPAMVAEARRLHPHQEFFGSSLPDLADITETFDNVLCAGVLMHLPVEQLINAVSRLAELLEPQGRLILTYRYSQEHESREADGRLFTSILPGKLELMLGSVALKVLYVDSQADTQRSAIRWHVVVAEKAPQVAFRGLDRLQSVLVYDRKDATYKLALLRALCDISRVEDGVAAWQNGQVYVPLYAIARRWLMYYWPLMTASQFIAQRRSEKPGGRLPIAFRNVVQELAREFDNNLFAVLKAMEENPGKFRRPLRKVAETIRVGPVQFAGGRGSRIFEYVPPGKLPGGGGGRQPEQGDFGWVSVPEAVWLDIARYEHWIQDSVVIHWAELTAELNKEAQLPLEQAFALLRQSITDERDTNEVRDYLGRRTAPVVCVWSDRELDQGYEIDHLIPYAVWANNDLWNLLPSSRQLNQAKRDALPTRNLLNRRRECIVAYWREYRDNWPNRFSVQIKRALGGQVAERQWEIPSFATLQEVVERIAVGHALKRWEP